MVKVLDMTLHLFGIWRSQYVPDLVMPLPVRFVLSE